MQIILLILLAAGLAVLLIQPLGLNRVPKPAEPKPPAPPAIDWDAAVSRLSEPLDALRELMEHPELGGPGFLTVQFPFPGQGRAEVSAQYPNIQETLYREIVRRTTETEQLKAVGIPEKLFENRIEFTPESGGMVLITAETAPLPDALWTLLEDRTGRQTAFRELTDRLGERYPEMVVRSLGGDLLLTPVQPPDA